MEDRRRKRRENCLSLYYTVLPLHPIIPPGPPEEWYLLPPQYSRPWGLHMGPLPRLQEESTPLHACAIPECIFSGSSAPGSDDSPHCIPVNGILGVWPGKIKQMFTPKELRWLTRSSGNISLPTLQISPSSFEGPRKSFLACLPNTFHKWEKSGELKLGLIPGKFTRLPEWAGPLPSWQEPSVPWVPDLPDLLELLIYVGHRQ